MLPEYARKELNEALEITKDNTGLNLDHGIELQWPLGIAECCKKYCL